MGLRLGGTRSNERLEMILQGRFLTDIIIFLTELHRLGMLYWKILFKLKLLICLKKSLDDRFKINQLFLCLISSLVLKGLIDGVYIITI